MSWTGSVNVDGVRVAGYDADDRESTIHGTLYYAFQYEEEVEKRMTITITKRKEENVEAD